MKIFDCFMYYDEDILLDVRLNTLDKNVDYFVIVESIFSHKGEKRDLKFNHKNFSKFRDKLIYLVYEEKPDQIEKINQNDTENEKSRKYIINALYRENGQRNFIAEGIKNADENDFILISDVDEIPNLKEINFKNLQERFVFFKQEMFYYKFNLKLPNYKWIGTKSCKKKYLKSPQWLRNIKDRNYPFYRLDTLFSKTKYTGIKFIDEGGWHFTNIKSAVDIRHKLKSYLHHREFDINPLSISEIDDLIKNKEAIYNLKVDKRAQKIGHGTKLNIYDIKKLPSYISSNQEKFKEWFD